MNSHIFDIKAFTGQFELTPQCNLNCKMCYIHENKEAGRTILPASFWIEKAQQAVDAGMLVLSITGGETLLYPELDTLMDALSSMGLLISFNTNGTLIDEKRVEWFLKYCPNKINISLYGASDETYEKLCGCKDGFTRVSKAIDLLMQAGLNVYLNGMITPYNLEDIPAMHAFAAKRGLILHLGPYSFPYRDDPGKNTRGEHRLSPEDAAKAYVWNQKMLLGPEQFRQFAASSLAGIELRRRGMVDSPCEACNGGCKNFQISYDGKLHPCAMLQDLSISLEDKPLTEGLKLLAEQMEELPFPDDCNRCDRKDLCPMCKAAVYLETGTHTTAPEYLCRYSETLEKILREECAGVRISLQHSGDFNSHHCEV